jgi:hypothetical protein
MTGYKPAVSKNRNNNHRMSVLLVLFETQLRWEQSMPAPYSSERSPTAIQNSGPKHPAGIG